MKNLPRLSVIPPSKDNLWVWCGRGVAVLVLLVFGYGVAYVLNHWQPEDFQAYVTTTPAPPSVDLTPLWQELSTLRQEVEARPLRVVGSSGYSLEGRLQALESLQGTVGNLSQVFLGQQLVILDNAYRQGGDIVPGIAHVKKFAETVAKNATVVAALEALQNTTPLSGPVTGVELVLTADALYGLEPLIPHSDVEHSLWQNLVIGFTRWVKVTHLDDIEDPNLSWDLGINLVRFNIAHGKPEEALNILQQAPFKAVEVVEPFRLGLHQYVAQQQALQAVHKAFIESYHP